MPAFDCGDDRPQNRRTGTQEPTADNNETVEIDGVHRPRHMGFPSLRSPNQIFATMAGAFSAATRSALFEVEKWKTPEA